MGGHLTSAWATAIIEWTAWANQQGWASTTIQTRLDHLHRDAKRLGADPWSVGPAQLRDWFNRQDWRQETRRGHRQTLRSFYGWAVAAGKVEASPALALPRVRPAAPRPKPLSDVAYVGAIATASIRERLMVRLAGEFGLRRAEVARCHSTWLVRDLEGWTLAVIGKGGKERMVPLTDLIASELLSLPPGYAFPGDDEGHLSPRWVGTIVSRLLPEGWGMHSLRHRFAARIHEIEPDLVVLQELLGHASILTTRMYVPGCEARARRLVLAAAGCEPVVRVA